MNDPRAYPDRPYLAVSAAIVRDGRILIVQRARAPGKGLYSLPGGAVEVGESLEQAVVREVREETGLVIAPIGLAGLREVVARDVGGRIERHIVILAYAARWLSGEPVLNDELSDARWLRLEEIEPLSTTEGLTEIVATALTKNPG
jgi:8-oxo-dGTP diphosphatase